MSVFKSFADKSRSLGRRLKRDTSGLALIEFAYTLPIFLGLGFYGIEVSNLAITQMKMSQIALTMADNASRIGTLDSNLGAKEIAESQINDVFQAAAIQAGHFRVFQDGRSVLSSLELNSDGGQTIRWQRCKGMQLEESDYGEEGEGETGTSFQGMGQGSSRVAATSGTAIMFVELTYTYQPLFGDMFIGERELRQEAAFTVRDKRALDEEPRDDVSDVRQSTCDKYDAILPQTSDEDIAAAEAAADGDGNNGHGNNDGGFDPSNPGQGGGGGNRVCVLDLICL